MKTHHSQLYIQSLLLILSGIFLLYFFPIGGKIDLLLSAPWVSNTGEFYLKNNWFLDTLGHQYFKYLFIFFYTILFFLWLCSFKFEQLKSKCFEYGYFFIVSMICLIAISILKAHSSHSCPWSMTVPTNHGFYWNFFANEGHCFPGGHASVGFSLITGFFIYQLNRPKLAYFYLSLGLIMGFSMGWIQIMRGAHFLSHNLWTLWITLFINILIIFLISKIHLFISNK